MRKMLTIVGLLLAVFAAILMMAGPASACGGPCPTVPTTIATTTTAPCDTENGRECPTTTIAPTTTATTIATTTTKPQETTTTGNVGICCLQAGTTVPSTATTGATTTLAPTTTPAPTTTAAPVVTTAVDQTVPAEAAVVPAPDKTLPVTGFGWLPWVMVAIGLIVFSVPMLIAARIGRR
jgi:hypothetical protein